MRYLTLLGETRCDTERICGYMHWFGDADLKQWRGIVKQYRSLRTQPGS